MGRTQHSFWRALFEQHPSPGETLQGRLRTMVVKAILDGVLTPGAPLPSSRQLSSLLQLSRNTVTLAYQHLADQAYIESLPRSGYRVCVQAAQQPKAASSSTPISAPTWEQRLPGRLWNLPNISKPTNWQDFPYPFIYGQFDAQLFPAHEWRECAIQALRATAVREWASDRIDQDDDKLIEQIQQRILPARGIWVSKDEILVTAGAQQANYILAEILFRQGGVLGLEDPGYPDVRNIYATRGAEVAPFAVGPDGLDLSADFSSCDYLYVTPSHQCPTTVTMPQAHRHRLLELANLHDLVLIEDDYDSELNFVSEPQPALKSLDVHGRVIYVGSLSKTIAPGLRAGFMVAHPWLIREARAARRLMMRHPPTNNERALALFLSLGHHDMLIRRISKAYNRRLEVLCTALRKHLPAWRFTAPTGGSALWIQGPPQTVIQKVAQAALEVGVIIEPGSIFFSSPEAGFSNRHARLGVASIDENKIAEGVEQLAMVIRRLGYAD